MCGRTGEGSKVTCSDITLELEKAMDILSLIWQYGCGSLEVNGIDKVRRSPEASQAGETFDMSLGAVAEDWPM